MMKMLPIQFWKFNGTVELRDAVWYKAIINIQNWKVQSLKFENFFDNSNVFVLGDVEWWVNFLRWFVAGMKDQIQRLVEEEDYKESGQLTLNL